MTDSYLVPQPATSHDVGLRGPHEPAALSLHTLFRAKIRNPHTRRAYTAAAADFFRFAATRPGGDRIETISPLHISAWLDQLEADDCSVLTIKARLAAVRRVFQSLAADRIIASDPATVVRGPTYSARRGKTPVLTPDEARQIIDCIDTSTLTGLRDRAIIATMLYSFARIGAVLSMKREDAFVQQRRLWLRLHEKRGKLHEVPCNHTLEQYLMDYIDAAAITDAKAPLFQSFGRGAHGDVLNGQPLTQSVSWKMIQRRARDAGITTHICNHTFRGTGITTYLKNGGTIENAAAIAAQASTRTTQLYDRRPDDITLDEVEKIRI